MPDGINTCINMNPCASNNCDPNAICNSFGSQYICTCREGFTGNGRLCSPVSTNVCLNNICNINADCIPVGINYRCVCHSGYLGNGLTCSLGANGQFWLQQSTTHHHSDGSSHSSGGHSIGSAMIINTLTTGVLINPDSGVLFDPSAGNGDNNHGLIHGGLVNPINTGSIIQIQPITATVQPITTPKPLVMTIGLVLPENDVDLTGKLLQSEESKFFKVMHIDRDGNLFDEENISIVYKPKFKGEGISKKYGPFTIIENVPLDVNPVTNRYTMRYRKNYTSNPGFSAYVIRQGYLPVQPNHSAFYKMVYSTGVTEEGESRIIPVDLYDNTFSSEDPIEESTAEPTTTEQTTTSSTTTSFTTSTFTTTMAPTSTASTALWSTG